MQHQRVTHLGAFRVEGLLHAQRALVEAMDQRGTGAVGGKAEFEPGVPGARRTGGHGGRMGGDGTGSQHGREFTGVQAWSGGGGEWQGLADRRRRLAGKRILLAGKRGFVARKGFLLARNVRLLARK